MKGFFKDKEGSLMIESMVAASLVVVGLLGLFNLIYNSTERDSLVIHQLQATYLAAEGIEVVKNISDADVANGNPWDSGPGNQPFDGCYAVSYDSNDGNLLASGGGINLFFATSSSGEGIFASQTDLNSSYLSPSRTLFTRSVCISVSGDAMTVNSTVNWSEHGTNQTTTLSDIFYNWRP